MYFIMTSDGVTIATTSYENIANQIAKLYDGAIIRWATWYNNTQEHRTYKVA